MDFSNQFTLSTFINASEIDNQNSHCLVCRLRPVKIRNQMSFIQACGLQYVTLLNIE